MQILRIIIIRYRRKAIKSSHNAETMHAVNQEARQKSHEIRVSEGLPFLHIHFAVLTTQLQQISLVS